MLVDPIGHPILAKLEVAAGNEFGEGPARRLQGLEPASLFLVLLPQEDASRSSLTG